jgi:hypothetical protein
VSQLKHGSLKPQNRFTPIAENQFRAAWLQCERCSRPQLRLARHVERPGGSGIDCCLRCLRWLAGAPVPVPTAAQRSARAGWISLFMPRPRGLQPGGIIAPLATPISAFRAETDSIGSDSEGPLCECGRPLADNRRPHAGRCDDCIDNRPAPPPVNPPPESDPCTLSQSRSKIIALPATLLTRQRRPRAA